MQLFPRVLEVIVGETDADAVSITGLSIKFNIKKVSSSKPVEGFVEIINLSDATDTFIKDKGQRIRISGGYPDRSGIIFDGDVRYIFRDRQGVDKITRVELGGNLRKLTTARFSRSYNGSVTVSQIVQDALPSFALTSANLDKLPFVQKNDFAFDGRTSDLLDRLLPVNGVNWREDSGVITFSKIGEPDDLVNVPVIAPRSGLIAIAGQEENGGIKFRSLLNPNLSIGKAVKIESEILGEGGGGRDINERAGMNEGFYKIISVNHMGESRGTAFYTDCEAIPYNV